MALSHIYNKAYIEVVIFPHVVHSLSHKVSIIYHKIFYFNSPKEKHLKKRNVNLLELIHCGLVKPYGDINLPENNIKPLPEAMLKYH